MSGVDLPDGRAVRKGAADAIEQYARAQGGSIPSDLHTIVEQVSLTRRHAAGSVRK